jgi:hypothetical protein
MSQTTAATSLAEPPNPRPRPRRSRYGGPCGGPDADVVERVAGIPQQKAPDPALDQGLSVGVWLGELRGLAAKSP